MMKVSKTVLTCTPESKHKKRLRYGEEDLEETPSKKRKEDPEDPYETKEDEEHYDARKRRLTDLFGEEVKWCEDCALIPCVCVLNTIELRITEEKTRKLEKRMSSQSTPRLLINIRQDEHMVLNLEESLKSWNMSLQAIRLVFVATLQVLPAALQ